MPATCQGPPIEGWHGKMLEHRVQGLAAHQLAKLVGWPDAPRLPTAVCMRCGALGIKQPRALRQECPMRPSVEGARVLAGLATRQGRVTRLTGIIVSVQGMQGVRDAGDRHLHGA